MLKSLPVIVHRAKKCFEIILMVERKNEGVGTLWLNKYLCHLVTGIYIFRWPNNAVRDMSKIFLYLNA